MEFDMTKVFTSLNADEVKVGSKGYFADSLRGLRVAVEREYRQAYGELDEIYNDSIDYRFHIRGCYSYNLFYLVEEVIKDDD